MGSARGRPRRRRGPAGGRASVRPRSRRPAGPTAGGPCPRLLGPVGDQVGHRRRSRAAGDRAPGAGHIGRADHRTGLARTRSCGRSRSPHHPVPARGGGSGRPGTGSQCRDDGSPPPRVPVGSGPDPSEPSSVPDRGGLRGGRRHRPPGRSQRGRSDRRRWARGHLDRTGGRARRPVVPDPVPRRVGRRGWLVRSGRCGPYPDRQDDPSPSPRLRRRRRRDPRPPSVGGSSSSSRRRSGSRPWTTSPRPCRRWPGPRRL